MEDNGSPMAKFETDGEERRYFLVELPIHEFFNSEFLNLGKAKPDNLETDLDTDLVTDLDTDLDTDLVTDLDTDEYQQWIERVVNILNYCLIPKSRKKIFDLIGLSNQTKNFQENLAPLMLKNWLVMTIPDKPTSSKQKYQTTDSGRRIIKMKS